jgi:CHAP domain
MRIEKVGTAGMVGIAVMSGMLSLSGCGTSKVSEKSSNAVADQNPLRGGGIGMADHSAVVYPVRHGTQPQDLGISIANIALAQKDKQCTPYRDAAGKSACDNWWCAVFTSWAWRQAGVSDVPSTWVATQTAVWGRQRNLFKPRPAGALGDPRPGDMAVYGQPGAGPGGHVAIVFSVNGDGTITLVNGDSGNVSSPRTSTVTVSRVNPATAHLGNGWGISGYVSPPGGGGKPAPPPPPSGGGTKYWVDIWATAPGRDRGGRLNKGRNYVFCKVWGTQVGTSSQFNHWWLKTDMDTGGQDYVSAYYLRRWGNDEAKDVNGTEIPNC